MVFINNQSRINFHLVMNFLSHNHEVLNGYWCQEHKWLLFSSFVILMTSLDHSLVHVLNKQEKISNVYV
jgi:hypothetical protein